MTSHQMDQKIINDLRARVVELKADAETSKAFYFDCDKQLQSMRRERDAAIQRGDSNYAAFEQVTKIAEGLREHLRKMLEALPPVQAEKIAWWIERAGFPLWADEIRSYARSRARKPQALAAVLC